MESGYNIISMPFFRKINVQCIEYSILSLDTNSRVFFCFVLFCYYSVFEIESHYQAYFSNLPDNLTRFKAEYCNSDV